MNNIGKKISDGMITGTRTRKGMGTGKGAGTERNVTEVGIKWTLNDTKTKAVK